MKNLTQCFLAGLCVSAVWNTAGPLQAEVHNANPENYQSLLRELKPGDTLNLESGEYRRLYLSELHGTASAWITVTGPASDSPAVIAGEPEHNTIEIENCSYVSIENLRIDSRGIPGAFGVSARGHENNVTHHIRLEGNTFVGQGGGQQTDAISTKTPTWGWVIRFNKILGAGTGMYFGDSDGSQPFVAGLIENNLVRDTIGYNIEIKDQFAIPAVRGMPPGPTVTIIRNNVFIKNDVPSPDGDRPNLLVGGFPDTGLESFNMYDIYGNLFVHNPREALFQGSGRFSLHDNIFLDGCPRYPAVVLAKRNKPLQVAHVYNNTIYTSGQGIKFETEALQSDAVVGNLVFASSNPITGPIKILSDNITGTLASARAMVRSPSFDPATADFYPLPGKCQGDPINLAMLQSDTDYTLDFNGRSKVQEKPEVVYRGAYAGEGQNSGWHLQPGVKMPNPPLPKLPKVVWISPAAAQAGSQVELVLTGANFVPGARVAVSGEGVQVAKTAIDSATEITATLTIAAGAAAGYRGVTVTTAMGPSNAFMLQVGSSNRQP